MKLTDALSAGFTTLDLEPLRPVQRAAVYLLAVDDVVVYVGQTFDVAARIRFHLSERLKPFNRVLCLEVDASELDAYEGALIRALNPEHNWRAPKDLGRDEEVLGRFGLRRDESGAFNARQNAHYIQHHPRKS